MSKLPINEVFPTMQGEASFTGMPSVFVRLQGCDVGCAFCDTKHTWSVDERNEITIDSMLNKTAKATPYFALMTAGEIAEVVACHPHRHVVVTGGEPCQYDLRPLNDALRDIGRTMQVETSGTEPIRVGHDCWVTVSPKIDMPGGKHVLLESINRANEIKMAVGKMADVEQMLDLLANSTLRWPSRQVWLQPLSRSPKATELCLNVAAAQNGWRVSIQTHAYIGIR